MDRALYLIGYMKKRVCQELLKCQMQLIYLLRGENDMSDYNFRRLKSNILEWHKKWESKLSNKCACAIKKNSMDILIIDFEFDNCLAQLSLTNSKFTPYQFIYFEAMEVVSTEELKQVYCVYDDKDTMLNDLMCSLDEAILFCLNYVVD